MKKHILLPLLLVLGFAAQAQDGGYPMRDVFYGTRAINLMTTTQVGKKVLAYRISHRFGSFDTGINNFFGLDGPANISLAFDYGISDDLMVGIARDGFNKNYNGFVKYNLLNQYTSGGSPISLSLYARGNILSLQNTPVSPDPGAPGIYDNFAHRMAYTTQIIAARKFGERISVQLAPTWIHHNLVPTARDGNDIIALSAAAQYKITKRIGITGEYSFVINEHSADPNRFRNSASVGLDIVTGGHIFQIVVGNTFPINETYGIPYTISDWLDGNIRLGFNISRKFWL